MEIARRLSGYSLAGADLLRRAMGKKVKAEMDAQEEMFVSGAVENKVPAAQAKAIFATVAKFAGYGFNKSHASAYGVISYQTAYLKANFPAEFLVACLNLDMDSSDKINIFLQEAKVFDIGVVSPDINRSKGVFSIDKMGAKKSIIFAIGAIKNVTPAFGNAVTIEREKNGAFKSIIDFAERMDPKLINRRLLENVIKAGCFDKLNPNRASLINSVPKIMAYCASYHAEQNSNQFSLISVGKNSSDVLIDAKEYSIAESAYAEFEVMGLFLENHPFIEIKKSLDKCGIKTSSYIKGDIEDGSHRLKLAGVITKKDARMSPRGRFITLVLADHEGIFEVTIFNEDILRDYSHLINVKEAVVVYCDVSKDKGGLRITAAKFISVEDELDGVQHSLKLYPQGQDEIQKIISLLESKKHATKSNSSIEIFLPLEAEFVAKVSMPKQFVLDENDVAVLEKK